jgi:hypothetical protein
MKSYGLDLLNSDVNAVADAIVAGSTFPNNKTTGSVFFLEVGIPNFAPGYYVYTGTNWEINNSASITAQDITNALGFTPVNSSNASVANTLSVQGTLSVGPTSFISTITSFVGGNQQMIDTFAITAFRSIKYNVQISDTQNQKFHSVEFNVIHDDTNVFKTEFALITTAGTLGNFDANINAGMMEVIFLPIADSAYTVKLTKFEISV